MKGFEGLEIKCEGYNSYTIKNGVDWIKRTLPYIRYCLGTDDVFIIDSFKTVFLMSDLADKYKEWFKNNLDVVIKRELELLDKRDPRRKV